jgi:hypothetical protein
LASQIAIHPNLRHSIQKEMEDIMNEIIEGHKNDTDEIIKLVFDKPYNYLFINTDSQRMFKNFDEIIFSDNI